MHRIHKDMHKMNMNENICIFPLLQIQWNLVIKKSDITKPSYNKVILLVPALYISLVFYPDIYEKPDITR